MKTKIVKGLLLGLMAFNFLLASTGASAYRYCRHHDCDENYYRTAEKCWWVPAHRSYYGHFVPGHRVCR